MWYLSSYVIIIMSVTYYMGEIFEKSYSHGNGSSFNETVCYRQIPTFLVSRISYRAMFFFKHFSWLLTCWMNDRYNKIFLSQWKNISWLSFNLENATKKTHHVCIYHLSQRLVESEKKNMREKSWEPLLLQLPSYT